MNLRLILFFLILLPFAANAQLPNEPAFQHLLPERLGIDKMYGTSIGSNGRVWMLTENGLVCYNGYSTKIYAAKPGEKNGLMSNLIQSIFKGFDISVELIFITELKNSNYFARLILKQQNEIAKKLVEIDARPSDCLALATAQKRPIYVASALFDQVEDMSEVLDRINETGSEAESE